MSLAIKASRMQAQGDPGLFGSIGKFLGGAAKIATGFIPGPIGGIARGLTSRLFRQPPPPVPTVAPVSRFAGIQQAVQQRRSARRGARRTGRVRATLVPPSIELEESLFPPAAQQLGATAPLAAGTQLACPPGFHANKTNYFLKNGTFVREGTKCVKARRRNPANMRAADRAIGRIESAKKLTKRLGRISIRKECP